MNGDDVTQEYFLCATLSEIKNNIHYCTWKVIWSVDGVHCYPDKWEPLKWFLDITSYEMRIGISTIKIADHNRFLLMFENTEYNLRLLRECIAE